MLERAARLLEKRLDHEACYYRSVVFLWKFDKYLGKKGFSVRKKIRKEISSLCLITGNIFYLIRLINYKII